MRETDMIAGKRSDVGVTFKKGGSQRNFKTPRTKMSLICTGNGPEVNSTDEVDAINLPLVLPTLARKSITKLASSDRYGVKSTVGNDVTFAKGGSKRYIPSEKSVIKLTNINTETFGDTNVTASGKSLCYHRSEFPEYHSPDSASHGKASNVGFDATFAKGGNRKNFATSEKQFPLPCLLASKFLVDKASYEANMDMDDYLHPMTSTAYSVEYNHIPVELDQSFGRKSNIGNDVTFSKGGSTRMFASTKSLVYLRASTAGGDSYSEEVMKASLEHPLTCPIPLFNRFLPTSPSTELWLKENSDNYGYGRRSFEMGPGSDPGTGPEMGGYRVSATRKSHRRNFSVPSPQVSFTSGDCSTDISEFNETKSQGLNSLETTSSLYDSSSDPVPWAASQFINGVKSTVGTVIFTGGHRKLFQHPGSQFSLSSSIETETETETDLDSTTLSYRKHKSNLI